MSIDPNQITDNTPYLPEDKSPESGVQGALNKDEALPDLVSTQSSALSVIEGGGRAKDNAAESREKSNLRHAGEYLEHYYCARYRALPEDHPITQYVYQLNKKFPQANVKIVILSGWSAVNAIALPNDTILLSRGLLDFCRYEEELMFVLGHERVHVKDHFEVHKRKRVSQIIKDVKKGVGQLRYQEMEADIKSVVREMSAAKVNPYGGKSFLQRVANELEHGDKKDVVHGGAMDRMLTLASVSRLYDQKELSVDMTPMQIPSTFRQVQSNTDIEKQLKSPFNTVKDYGSYTNSVKEHLEVIGSDGILFAAQIQGKVEKAREEYEEMPSLTNKTRLEFCNDLMVVEIGEAKKHIANCLPELSSEDRDLMLMIYLYFVGQIDVLSIADPKDVLNADIERFWEMLDKPELFDRLEQLFQTKILTKLGHHLIGNPEKWLEKMLIHACDADRFGSGADFDQAKYLAFAKSWINTLDKAFVHLGLSTWKMDKCVSLVFDAAWPNINPNPNSTKVLELAAQCKVGGYFWDKEVDYDPIQMERDRVMGETLYNYPELGNKYHDLVEKRDRRPKDIMMGNAAFCEKNRKKDQESFESLGDIREKHRKNVNAYLKGQVNEFLKVGNFQDEAELIRYLKEFHISGVNRFDRLKSAQFALFCKKCWKRFKKDVGNEFPIDAFFSMVFEDYPIIGDADSNFAKDRENDMKLPGVKEADEEHIARSVFDASYIRDYWGLDVKPVESSELEQQYVEKFVEKKLQQAASRAEAVAIIRRYQDYGLAVAKHLNYKIVADLVIRLGLKTDDDQDGRDLLLLLSESFSDASRAIRVQSEVLRGELAGRDFDQSLNALFNDSRSAKKGDLGLRDDWMERESHSPEQLDKLESGVLESVNSLGENKEALRYIGKMGLIDVLSEGINSKVNLLRVLLKTYESDRELKEELLKLPWRIAVKGTQIVPHINEVTAAIWALGDEGRYAFLRMLLVGKNGVFMSAKTRKEFLNDFLSETLEDPSGGHELIGVFKEIAPELARINDPELFYFAFSPLLLQRFARYPKKITPWEEILKGKRYKSKEIAHMLKYQHKAPPIGHGLPSTQVQSKETHALNEYIDQNLLPARQEDSNLRKMQPMELVVEIAKSLGAVGVRFLQVVGQYMKLSPEYEKTFSAVYDQMRGQAKLAAYHTLRREWPEFADQVAQMHPRVGGGSLMTVYEIETKSGEKEVIKILNPNLEYHMERTFEFLEKLIDAMISVDKSRYEPVKFAIRDIKQWINEDIDLETFPADDARFRVRYHGWKAEDKPDGEYAIGVPETFEPANKYFIREQYVEGKNLTKWEELMAEGHDMKSIVELICKNYWTQLADGLVHADVHIGNIRVTEDKKCYILDRAGYLKFDDADRDFMFAILTGFYSDVNMMLDYLWQFDQTEFDLQMTREKLKGVLETELKNLQSPQQFVLHLKRNKVNFPVKLTLLVKNIGVLDGLAKKAGYSGLMEVLS